MTPKNLTFYCCDIGKMHMCFNYKTRHTITLYKSENYKLECSSYLYIYAVNQVRGMTFDVYVVYTPILYPATQPIV